MGPDDPTVTAPVVRGLPARAGKYRIVGAIGQGGMGVVCRAVDDDLGRSVALKFIPPEFTDHPEAEERFLREARAASALDHVNIGTIFGVEQTDDHRRFIVMAFYEGQSLSDRMRDNSRPVSPGEAVSIGIQIARGLNEAHAHGVTHRDIKPSNVMLTAQGIAKIVDFGLASMAGAGHLTATGARMGTPAYMSPEQALGKTADHRSDIWSLGVVVLEMLTGKRTFQAESVPGVLYKVVHGRIPTLDNVQQPFRSVLAKALAKEPEKRYPSMREFLEAMEAVQAERVTVRTNTRPSLLNRLTLPLPPAMQGPRAAIAAAILFLVLAGAAVYYWKGQGARGNKATTAAATASSSAFDKYLQGIELMKRWDKENNLAEAVALFTNATTADPGFALGFARLAEAQRISYALTGDKTLLESASKNAQEALRLNPELAPVQVIWGRIQGIRGNNDLAMASFERALKIDFNDAEAHQATAGLYNKLGRFADAEGEFRKALTLDPDSIFILDAHANFLFGRSRYADAIREWQTVIRLAPDDAAAYVNLGSALSESGKIAEAITMYERAVALKPKGLYMAYTNLGTAYSRAGRYPDAISAYKKALDLPGSNYMVRGNLAYVYSWMNGLDDRARQTFASAIQLAEEERRNNPRDPFVHSDLALYYAKTGNQPLARQRLATALALSSEGPEIQAAAAEVYELLGERANAIVFAKKSLGLGYSRQRLERNPELSKLMPLVK